MRCSQCLCGLRSHFYDPDCKSNLSLSKSCPALGRLNQTAPEPISVNKREDNWDLKVDDAKTLVLMRVNFMDEKVNDLLKVDGLLCLHRSKCQY